MHFKHAYVRFRSMHVKLLNLYSPRYDLKRQQPPVPLLLQEAQRTTSIGKSTDLSEIATHVSVAIVFLLPY